MTPNESDGNYFALLRLVRKLSGKDARRSQGTWAEAHFIGVAVYLISYLFAAHLLLPWLRPWMRVPTLLGLVLVVWLLWLIVVYLNSLMVKLCWALGLFTDLSGNRIQSVLIGILTSVFAAELISAGSWTRWIGIAWIAAVMLNLSAALLLVLNDEESS
ncbi:MAG: hypothetical protein ABJB22_07320 [Verrucomicrobiota bacterium]